VGGGGRNLGENTVLWGVGMSRQEKGRKQRKKLRRAKCPQYQPPVFRGANTHGKKNGVVPPFVKAGEENENGGVIKGKKEL